MAIPISQAIDERQDSKPLEPYYPLCVWCGESISDLAHATIGCSAINALRKQDDRDNPFAIFPL